MKKITVECSDEELIDKIERFAASRGLDVKDAATRLLRTGAGLPEVPRPPGPIGNALDEFRGVWTDEEADQQKEFLKIFRTVDADAWK